jgi:hypothetical protein
MDSFYEEFEHVYDKFPKYDMKVGREDIFKLTIGNESLHEISNDKGVRVVNFVISKNLTVKSTMSPQCNIHKFTRIPLMGKTHNQIDHILIDRLWHSSELVSEAECDTIIWWWQKLGRD